MSRLEQLLADIRREFPGFRLLRKDRVWHQRWIHQFLRIVTFGKMHRYLADFQTTIGQTIYVTSDWEARTEASRWISLRHERVHMRQFDDYTRPLMGFLYLFVFLPLGLAYFRARFEKQGYAETIRATAELRGRAHVERDAFRDGIIAQFTGPSYGWMWPFRRSMLRWYAGIVASLPPDAPQDAGA